MSLTSNPFHILGAKMTDDRRRIVALAKEKSFGGDEEAVREAQRILLTPKKRLAAEIAWLPGVEPDQIGELLTATLAGPNSAEDEWLMGVLLPNLPGLARANLLAHMLVHSGALDASARQPVASEEFWARRIALLAGAHHAVRTDEVTALVNEGRLAAGVPTASKQDVIEELQDRANSFRDTIEHRLDDLPLPVMVKAITSAVNMATRGGSRHAPALIDSLIDAYYVRRVGGTMDQRERGIANLVSRVRTDISGGKISRVPAMVAEIERSLRAWDALAQPIQLSLASRGMSHSPSNQIMHDTRNLAVEMINEHGAVLFKVARGLTKTLREVFAEMEPITELLDEDVATLDGISAGAQPLHVTARDSPAATHSSSTAPAEKPILWAGRLTLWAATCCLPLVYIVASVQRPIGAPVLIEIASDTGRAKSQDPKQDVQQEINERLRFLVRGEGNPSRAWLEVLRREGTLDDHMNLAERAIQFIRSLEQGAADVPAGILEGASILTSGAENVSEDALYRAGQAVRKFMASYSPLIGAAAGPAAGFQHGPPDPRAAHSFLTSRVPRALGVLGLFTVFCVMSRLATKASRR